MDVLYKGGSLLYTQISSCVGILLTLPACILACIWRPAARSDGESGSCLFYEGVVTHARKRPVANTFE